MGFDIPDQDDAEDLPDWLQGLQTGSLAGPAAGAEDTDAQSSDSDEELPDWLDAPVMETGASTPAADDSNVAEDVPDWLNSIREAEGTTGELPVEDLPEPAEGEAPDWLENIREKEGTTGTLPADALEDSAFSLTEDPPADDVNPEWLQGIREQESVEPPEEPAPEEAASSGDFLDRIQELKEEDGLLDPVDEPEEDWLSGLGDSETGALFASKDEATEADSMDWLTSDTSPQPEATDGVAFPETDEPAAEKPGWLAGMGDAEPLPGLETSAEAKSDKFDPEITDAFIASAESVDDAFPDLPGAPGEGVADLPNWLDKVKTGSLDPTLQSDEEQSEQKDELLAEAISFSPDEEFSLDDESLPSWLSDIEPEDPQLVDDEPDTGDLSSATSSTNPFAVETLNEEPAMPAFDLDQVADVADTDEDIERANLPSWLQAMRPVGPVTPSETDQHIVSHGDEETIGPLAGLRGVLPAEPAIVQFGDEVTEQSIGLRILDREHHQAEMLHDMVQREGQARRPKRQSGMRVRTLFKVLTGIAMYLLVFAAVFLGLNMSSLPNVYAENASAAQVRNTFELIESGLKEGPVLIVFDYEPAFIGEMNAAAGALVLQLAMQNRVLVLVSTTPSGAALAEEFMSMTRTNAAGLVEGMEHYNIGLITGGASGVLNFAYNPRNAAPKIYSDGSDYWSYKPLNQIVSIRDFAAVIILADDVEDAQVWVEQAEPYMRDEANPAAGVPLIVVASAQTEPLLYPYTQTSPAQIDGLIAGIKGGAYYESRMARNYIAARYWDGYGIGLTVVVIIIGLSSVGGMASGLFRRNQEEDENA